MKQYILLTKPGIIFGNLITAFAGFMLAIQKGGTTPLFIASMIGLALIIAAACVYNNYFDRDIDKLMKRTENRPFVVEAVSVPGALFFASVCLFMGSFILEKYTNLLTLLLAVGGFFGYVVCYGIAKRKTHHATLVGSVAGAMPPMVGYCAVTGTIDLTAVLVFFLVLFWQIPHFFAIALYRLEEYKMASIPVLPATQGMTATKKYMFFSIVAFTAVCIALWVSSNLSTSYLLVSSLLCAGWIWLCASSKSENWARKMFFYSLIVIMVLCAVIAVSKI